MYVCAVLVFNTPFLPTNCRSVSVSQIGVMFYVAFFKQGAIWGEPDTCTVKPNKYIPRDQCLEVHRREDGCLAPDCMYDLQFTMVILFVWSNVGDQVNRVVCVSRFFFFLL